MVLGSTVLVFLGLLLLSMPIVFCLGASAVVGLLLERTLYTLLVALNSVPKVALAPLFLIWFGLGLGSKVAVGFSLSFFIVLSSMRFHSSIRTRLCFVAASTSAIPQGE